MNKLKGFCSDSCILSEQQAQYWCLRNMAHMCPTCFSSRPNWTHLGQSEDGAKDNVFQLKSTQSHSKACNRPADCYYECDHLPHLGTKNTSAHEGAVPAAQDEHSTKSHTKYKEVHGRSRTEMTG